VNRKDVSAGLGHQSESTTAIYTTLAVPPKLPPWY
jgi:hypothetical protein